MLLAIAGTVVGLVVLSYAADQFVIGAARMATALRISAVVVGAVVIGFGTSAPELLVSGIAAIRGSADLAIGNVVGSNIANLTLVLGVAALITPIATRSGVLKREAPLSLGVTILFTALVGNGLGVLDGTLLAITMVVSLGIIIAFSRVEPDELDAQVGEFVASAQPDRRRETIRTIIGLGGTILGAQMLVSSATTIATELGVAEGLIGLTVVAVGTSLPELATAIQAARRRHTDLIIGNLLGSNLFNAGAVGAVIGLAGPDVLDDPGSMNLALIFMVAISLVSLVFMITRARVVRWEGIVLLAAYAAAMPILFL